MSNGVETIVESGSEAGSDRRRTPRQKFVTKALLYRDDRSAAPQRVTLRDISMKGIGFDSARPVEPGSRCRIKVEAGPVNTTLKVRVVCCGRIDDDHYRLGGQFIVNEIEAPETDEAATPDEEDELGPYLMLPESNVAVEPDDISPLVAADQEELDASIAVEEQDISQSVAIEPEEVTAETVAEPEDITDSIPVEPEDTDIDVAVEPQDVTPDVATEPEDLNPTSMVEPASPTQPEPQPAPARQVVKKVEPPRAPSWNRGVRL